MAINYEAEYAERERREARFDEDYGGTGRGSASRMTTAQVADLEKRYGLFCGTCGHGHGCDHDVPMSRWPHRSN